jgi:GAF domain-containing protein
VLGELPATAAALERREPLVVCRPSDARLGEAERRRFEREGFCSEVALPLAVDDRVVGVIELFSEECTDWADDLDFLRSVAQLVAGALDKALLLGELERRNVTLEARTSELDQLVEAGLEFGASLELEQVLQSAATRMAELAGATGCDLYRLEDGVAYTLMSVKHGVLNDTYVESSFPLKDYALWSEAVREQRPVAVEDILADPRAGDRDRWAAEHWGTGRSSICRSSYKGG